MAYSADLVLTAPAGSRRIERANVALNHGLVIGELLGIQIRDAQRVLDAVHDREEPVLQADEVATLRETYRAARAALDLAITPAGAPAGQPGEALRASDLLETAPSGELVLAHRHVPLTRLRAELADLDRVFADALAPGAALRLEQT
jgi:hypothetical protein